MDRKKTKGWYGNTIILAVFITVVFFFGCSRIENKEHVAQKVGEMYSNIDPLAEFNKFNRDLNNNDYLKGIDDFESRMQARERHMREIAQNKIEYEQKITIFNKNCRQKVINDPILKKYFESFCERNKKEKPLSINNLSFWGFETILNLEEELGIKLLNDTER